MKQKGFAITGILYVLLIIFLASLTMLLFNLQNRKMILDQLKLDVVEAVENNNNYEYLLNKISELEAKVEDLNTITSTLQNGMNLSKRETVKKTINIQNNWSWHNAYTYIAPKDGIYIFNGFVYWKDGKTSGGKSIALTSPSNSEPLVYHQYYQDVKLETGEISVTYYLKKGESVTLKLAQQGSLTSIPAEVTLEIQSAN